MLRLSLKKGCNVTSQTDLSKRDSTQFPGYLDIRVSAKVLRAKQMQWNKGGCEIICSFKYYGR